MRTIISIAVGKAIAWASKLFGKGLGKSAPGLYALKISRDLIESLSSQINTNIIITGTNGKSTTARLLVGFLRSAGFNVVNNLTGSNLERGVASELLTKANVFGKIKNVNYGVWELDEAAFVGVAHKLKPKVVVFLNALRDQLDRYGEVDSVVKGWKKSLSSMTERPFLILNKDDANVASLSKLNAKFSLFFGVVGLSIRGEGSPNERAIVRPKKGIFASDVRLNGLISSQFLIRHGGERLKIELPLPGVWHIYDFLAAFTTAKYLGVSFEAIRSSLEHYSPMFGRVERVKIDGKDLVVCLIKNPTGASEVLKLLSSQIRPDERMVIALNDNLADGRDVSWIWDANFEVLLGLEVKITCSGKRAEELALRLKYAGVNTGNIEIEKDIEIALERSLDEGSKVYVLPTYTALLNIEKLLRKRGISRHYEREV